MPDPSPQALAAVEARPILAIDPGCDKSGVVRLDCGLVGDFNWLDNDAVAYAIKSLPKGSLVAIEWISSYGMTAGREMFDTCRWEARFEMVAGQCGHAVMRVLRRDVKRHLCENPSANDKAVNEAVRNRWGDKGTKKNPGGTYGFTDHTYAALAVASYALDTAAGRVG